MIEYIAPCGGGMLHLGDRQLLGGQETTINQNPILFLAYMARATGVHNPVYFQAVLKHAECTNLGYGRYIRRKGDPLRQSHDNVLAWAWWSVQLNLPVAESIYNFTKWRFFIYDPHHYYSLDVRCWLQPSHIFILSLSANKKPGWLSCIWFSVSCLVADHAADYYLKSSLRSDIIRSRQSLLSNYKRRIVFWALELMEKRRDGMKRWYKDYYRDQPDHPAVLEAK
jgi:hypothetical protein